MFFEVYSFKSKSSSNVYQLFCSQPSLRNISSISYSRVCFHHLHQIDMASCKFASGISHLLRTRIFHLLKIFKKGLNIPQRLPKAVNRRTDSRMANKKKQRFTRHYTESKRSRNIITGCYHMHRKSSKFLLHTRHPSWYCKTTRTSYEVKIVLDTIMCK